MKPGDSDERTQKAHLPRSIETMPHYAPQYETSMGTETEFKNYRINRISNRFSNIQFTTVHTLKG